MTRVSTYFCLGTRMLRHTASINGGMESYCAFMLKVIKGGSS